MSKTYNSEYYHNCCGPVPYENTEHWETIFNSIADHIVADFHPTTVLDAGCAMGYLVAALRDRGVEAYGLDISEYAISRVRGDIRKYCAVRSLVEELPEGFPTHYDLITNIEVLEHIYEREGVKAIENLCRWSNQILFSSSPDDITEATHVNVQQPEYWVKHFADFGFFRQVNCDISYISPNAICFCKKDTFSAVVEDYERERRLLFYELKGNEDIGRSGINGNVYFDCGEGFSERNKALIATDNKGELCKRIFLPTGCQAIRLDPVEGYGCLVWNLQVSTENRLLSIKQHNGILGKNALIFSTIDPQIYFNLPEGSHWINIEYKAFFLRGAGWTGLTRAVEELEAENRDKRHALAEVEKALASAERVLASVERALASEKKALEKERDNSYNLQELSKHYETLVQSEKENSLALSNALNDVLNSKIWKCTKPFRVGCDFFRRCLSRKTISSNEASVQVEHASKLPIELSKTTEIAYRITGNPIDPIQKIYNSEGGKRLNLVTDTINSDSLLGGVATALILATEFVNRYDYELRIITRNTEVNPLNYENIMRISGIEPARKISYYSDSQRYDQEITFKLDVTPQDIFLATSWWSAKAVLETTIRKRFFYVIQEVETFFYNFGGEHLLCDQIMKCKDIDFIVNSSYLFEYFRKNEPNITENGCYFEPAFPKQLYERKEFIEKDRYKLFFYARPNNPRNLFTVGINMLDNAIKRGIIDTGEWEIYCVGQDVPEITFCNGYKSVNLGQLSWTEYAQFLSDVDLGLCLMYTPHPSYPPFDVACSGGVVLSNKMYNKTSFDMCKNVILSDLDEETFMCSFAEAVDLAKNMEQRKLNYETNMICRDWKDSLNGAIMYMKEKADNV